MLYFACSSTLPKFSFFFFLFWHYCLQGVLHFSLFLLPNLCDLFTGRTRVHHSLQGNEARSKFSELGGFPWALQKQEPNLSQQNTTGKCSISYQMTIWLSAHLVFCVLHFTPLLLPVFVKSWQSNQALESKANTSDFIVSTHYDPLS